MGDGGQRWRVKLHEGGADGAYRIEVDDGGGFRWATVIEVDQALRATTFRVQQSERSAERRNTRRNVPRNTKRNTRAERAETPESLPKLRPIVPVIVPRNTSGTPAERSAEHPPAFRGTPERNAEIRRRRAAGESVRTIARALGVGVATVHRAVTN